MYILTHTSLSISARMLAEQLEELTGISLEISYEPLRTAPLIRWGNSRGSFANDTKFNSPKGIKVAGNKVGFSNFMSTLSIPYVELNTGHPNKYPVIVRTILNGSEGAGIVIVKSESEMLEAGLQREYWSYFYKFQYELGVHILSGRVAKLFKKVWNGEGTEPDIPIRNMKKGYHFKRVSPDNFEKLHPFVERFYSEFDIEFCRADVGWDSENKCYRIIEINTAPSLSNNDDTLQMYSKFLAERIR